MTVLKQKHFNEKAGFCLADIYIVLLIDGTGGNKNDFS